MDSIPVVALTGQVTTKLIGSDAFQEADTFGSPGRAQAQFPREVPRDLPQAIHEAFYIAASGRPGPVLVDIPKDVFIGGAQYAPVETTTFRGTNSPGRARRTDPPRRADDVGGAAPDRLRGGRGDPRRGVGAAAGTRRDDRRAGRVHADGLGGSLQPPNFISMPGMHGSYAANMAFTHTDLIIALGARFDDRVTGRLDAFAPTPG